MKCKCVKETLFVNRHDINYRGVFEIEMNYEFKLNLAEVPKVKYLIKSPILEEEKIQYGFSEEEFQRYFSISSAREETLGKILE